MASLIGFAFFVAGCLAGLDFPDLDQKFVWAPVLVHRSILTHNPFLPLLLLFLLRRFLNRPVRLFLIGLSLALAVHFAFDLFPRKWIGFALIYVPFHGQTDPVFSQVWLSAGLVLCLGLAAWLIRSMGEFVVSFGGLTLVYGDCAIQEPRVAFCALLWLMPVSFLAFVLSRPKDDPDDPGARFRRMMSKP